MSESVSGSVSLSVSGHSECERECEVLCERECERKCEKCERECERSVGPDWAGEGARRYGEGVRGGAGGPTHTPARTPHSHFSHTFLTLFPGFYSILSVSGSVTKV